MAWLRRAIKEILGMLKIAFWLVLWIFTFLFSINILRTYSYQDESEYIDRSLISLMNSVLGVPYFEEPYFRNDSKDIIKISKEEWMSLKCNPSDFDRSDIVFRASNFLFHDQDPEVKKLPLKDKWHLNCLRIEKINPWDRKGEPKKVNDELCNNIFNCQIDNIIVKDYVLQKPEILWNMIKIAERPCDYVKRVEEADADDTVPYIMSIRNHLYCSNKFFGRKYIIITVVSESDGKENGMKRENYPMLEIIVRRQDID